MRRCARVTKGYVVGKEESTAIRSFRTSDGMAGPEESSAGNRSFTPRPACNAKS